MENHHTAKLKSPLNKLRIYGIIVDPYFHDVLIFMVIILTLYSTILDTLMNTVFVFIKLVTIYI